MTAPLLQALALGRRFGRVVACRDIGFGLHGGEVLGVVGESGSGKTTLLNCLAGALAPTSGQVLYRPPGGGAVDIWRLAEPERRRLMRQHWGFVAQNAAAALRFDVSAGGNVGESLMAAGWNRYGAIRAEVARWLERVELDTARMDERPGAFSGGMQQRLQIARALIAGPRLVFMDEPTGGLDVSVQARLLDLLRGLVAELGLAAVVVTHDLAVARLLADRLLVMRRGEVVEQGLADRVLDDPHHPHTQLLVSSVLQP